MLLGISVEDSIYLSIVGVGRGHLRPVIASRKTSARSAVVRGDAARRAAIDHKLARLRRVDLSHGEHRQVALAMALAPEPRHAHARRAGVGPHAASGSS